MQNLITSSLESFETIVSFYLRRFLMKTEFIVKVSEERAFPCFSAFLCSLYDSISFSTTEVATVILSFSSY